MTATPEQLAEAAALRESARAHYAAEQESFDRCDTDGFLSQWASRITGQEAEAKARLLEAGGTVETDALFFTDGRVASTHEHAGQYGLCWVLNDEAAEFAGKRFLGQSRARSGQKRYDALKAKGFVEGRIRVRGYVTVTASGTGLSGAASARVVTRPVVDELRAGNFEIVTTDSGPGEDWA